MAWLNGQCLNVMWHNLDGQCSNATWHLPNQNGFDSSKNHLIVVLTIQHD
jgi:hypothetical protein